MPKEVHSRGILLQQPSRLWLTGGELQALGRGCIPECKVQQPLLVAQHPLESVLVG